MKDTDKKDEKTAEKVTELNKAVMAVMQPLLDKNAEQATLTAELLGQIALLAKADKVVITKSRESKLGMIDALIDIQKVAKTVGCPINNLQIAEAYGMSTTWVSRTFKVANDSDKRNLYLTGHLTITGGATSGNGQKDKIKTAHDKLIEEDKEVTALALAQLSGESLEDCVNYLEDFVGSLEKQGAKVLSSMLNFFDFTPKTKKGENDTTAVNEDMKVLHMSTELVSVILSKEVHGGAIRRTLKDTLKTLGYEVKQADKS